MAVEILSLHSNSLAGSIPDSIFEMAINMPIPLSVIDLHSNSLTGTIPANIGSMTKLTKVILHSNFIYGTLPSQLSILASLSLLDLHMNYLTMGSASTVPTSRFSSATLSGDLDLSSNCLSFTSVSKPVQNTTPTRCAPTSKQTIVTTLYSVLFIKQTSSSNQKSLQCRLSNIFTNAHRLQHRYAKWLQHRDANRI
jgi:Leucine-rich repeat (LRR) protein